MLWDEQYKLHVTGKASAERLDLQNYRPIF